MSTPLELAQAIASETPHNSHINLQLLLDARVISKALIEAEKQAQSMREALENAPHSVDCVTNFGQRSYVKCDCWKSAALAQVSASPRTEIVLALCREDAGIIFDALMEHAASARKRKAVNIESTSDERSEACERIMRSISGPSASPKEEQPK